MVIMILSLFWFIEDYIDDNKCNEWTPEIPFENVSLKNQYPEMH